MLKAKYYNNRGLLELVLENAVSSHREMWEWIANKTEELQRVVTKEEYFVRHPRIPRPLFNCYPCDFVYKVMLRDRSGMKCKYCPFDWGSRTRTGTINCESWHSPYKHWSDIVLVQGPWEEAAKYARMIAELPLKEVVK